MVASSWSPAVARSGFDMDAVMAAGAAAFAPKPDKGKGGGGSGGGSNGGSTGGAGHAGGGGGSGGGGAPAGPSKSVTLSTKLDARSLGLNAAQEALGRDLTADELGRFHKALNRLERRHPTVSSPADAGGVAVQSGGVSAAAASAFADRWVEKGPRKAESDSYQLATTYLDTFMKTLKSATGGVL